MSKSFIDRANTTISLLALVVSGFALLFSYYSFREGQRENLAFLKKPILENYTTRVHRLGDKIVVPMMWEITVSNNGAKAVSIVDIEAESKVASGIVLYSNMFNGLFFEKDKPADLPINIASGESKKYLISLGILCDSAASAIINHEVFPFGNFDSTSSAWSRLNVLKRMLADRNIDFYGNSVTGTFKGEDLLTYQVDPKKQQTFVVKLISASKQTYTVEIKLYDNAQ